MKTRAPSIHNHPDSPWFKNDWLRFLVCCAMALCGFRAFLIEKFGASIAAGDDLDGIARRILMPFQAGTLKLSALFAAHNGDHRIVATRLWEILWFVLNGSWDPKLVMITKVVFYAAAAMLFVHVLAGRLERRRFLVGGALAVLFAFPFAYQNMLWAFQSQFDFFLLSAALGWGALLAGHTALALVVASLSIFTLGSGPIVAASFVPFFFVQWRRGRWPGKKALVCTAIAAVIVVGGLLSPTSEAPPHVGTPGEKAAMLLKLYAWPFSNLFSAVLRLPETARQFPRAVLNFPNAEHSWLLGSAAWLNAHDAAVVAIDGVCALFVAAPTLALLVALVRQRVGWRLALGPLAIAAFAFLMLVATALARAEEATIPMRYLDHVSLAGYASVAAAFVLVSTNPRRRRLFALWGLVLGMGYAATMVATWAQMRQRVPEKRLAILQRYFATTPHDHAALTADRAFELFIVSPDPTQFMRELDDPNLPPVLPRAVTHPGSAPGPAARVAEWIGKIGWLLALAAAGVAAAIARRARRVASPVAAPGEPVTPLLNEA